MDRRKSLKIIATTAVAGAAVAGCETKDKKGTNTDVVDDGKQPALTLDRNPDEQKNEKRLNEAEDVFNEHEMKTIAVLSDIIIPKDDVSGSATEAKVPEFIAFIVKDMPSHQVPMLGGLRWLDVHCINRFGKSFIDCDKQQQLQVVDDIAYPNRKIRDGMQPGVAFFTLMRNLTATGFYTSEIGVKDIGYLGNVVNKWNGVPEDVLKQYNVAYTEKELRECAKY